MLADEFGVSGERVRQIEVLAFEKVKRAAQHWVTATDRPERRHHRPQAVSHAAVRRVIRRGDSIGNKSPTAEVSL